MDTSISIYVQIFSCCRSACFRERHHQNNTPGYRDLFIGSGQVQGAVTNLLVESNTIADSLWNGMRAEGGVTYVTIRNNTFTNNVHDAIDIGVGLLAPPYNDHITVTENTIDGTTNGTCIYLTELSNSLVDQNTIYNCRSGQDGDGSGIKIQPQSPSSPHPLNNTIQRNIIYNNQFVGIYVAGTDNTKLYNNTIYNNGNSSSGGAIYNDGNNPGINSCNELAYANQNIIGTPACNGVSQPENVSYNPLFVNPAAGDFHLQSGSQAIDAGVNVGLPYNGSASDRGALEFGTSASPTPSPSATPAPSVSPHPIPGRIEAEDYNVGGESIGYHDTTPGNTSGQYRTDDVDIHVAAGGSGYTVGWTATGEWLAYTITVQSSGSYTPSLRVARGASGSGALHLEVDGQNVTGSISIPSTNDWNTEATITAPAIQLSQGTHTLKLVWDNYDVDVNYIDLTSRSTACSQYTSSTPIPPGFGSPYDVVSAPTTALISAVCDASSATITLGRGDPLQYIYNTGYLFKLNATNWTPISYISTETLVSNAWYPKSANTTIPMTTQELQNTSYLLGYLCTWTGFQWKCGCRDNACTQSYWQIQSFKR